MFSKKLPLRIAGAFSNRKVSFWAGLPLSQAYEAAGMKMPE